ncbi:phage tail tape measure protein [Hymenobacter sediminicola]|uniref:Phage tail tape measure protein n=1 Tax=Hymenobacter sediminicola TaxID=2761579 RepID=A0A7G7W309_9BACT|nr:phage tail tape measure protein [Hymenobacter sediminicola]QNH60752.1 phage tail tape measure protein [Hymenobacter sediminicola]
MTGPISHDDLFNELGPGARELAEYGKSVQSLNRNVRALGKNLDADASRIAAGLAGISDATKGIREQVAGLKGITDQERTMLAGLSSQVAKLAQDQDRYKAALAGQATVRKQTEEATKGLTKALREQQSALKAAFAAGNMEAAQKAAINVLNLKRQTDQLNKAVRGANSELTAAAGSYNRLSIETQQLGDKIRALPGGFEAAGKEANELKKQFADNTQRLKDFDRELNQNFREVGSYAKGILEAVAALEKQKGTLVANIGAMQQQSRATGLSADQQDRLQQEIKQTEAELGKVNGQLKNYGVGTKESGGLTAGLSAGVGGLAQNLAGAYYGLQGLSTGLQKFFTDNVELSVALNDVRKTTGLTADEADRLTDSLKAIPTTTSLSGLLDEAKVGGQLGKTKDEIEGFVRSIDVATQALSDDFQGGAEEIATSLGKIELVFKKSLGPDQEKNLLNIGSALNELGAEGAATAPFLADVALRTGASAATFGLALPTVLAYAAALQETGFSAEVSGTALNRLFSTLSTRTDESFAIAKLADSNLTLKEFKRLINTDFEAAINVFLAGLNKGGTSTTRLNGLLKTLKLQSGEAKSVIITLAKNQELLAERQKTANEQLADGTSLAAEAAVKLEGLGGSWKLLKNDVSNFFTSGAASKSLQYLVDFVRFDFKLGAAGLRGIGDGFSYIGKKVGVIKPAQQDVFSATAKTTKGLLEQADTADKLLTRYQALASQTSRNAGEQREMADITSKLQQSLGRNVVNLDKQTGAVKLNTGAVEDAVFATRRLAIANEKDLVRSLTNAQASVAATEQSLASLTGLVGGQKLKLDAIVPDPERAQELANAMRDVRDVFGSTQTLGPSSGFTLKEIAAAEKYIDAEARLLQKQDLLKKQQQDLKNAQNALNSVRKAGTAVIVENKDAGEEEGEELDKKKKQIADVAKAQYELNKSRLEARLADLSRQAENPANSEAIRTDAIRKASAVRVDLAELERDELIRVAAQTYKDQVNGAAALNLTRRRLSEEFRQNTVDIEREGNKQLLALRRTLLDQLAAIDKLALEAEANQLDLIAQDESLSYTERQQAALDAAARRIEIAELEAEGQRRAAEGNAKELLRIEQELQNKRDEQLRATRPFNADLANDELEGKYAQQQLALEKRLSAGLISERTYKAELRKLEDAYLAVKLGNLQTDKTKRKEAIAEELEQERAKNQRKLEEEKRLQELRAELIQEGLQQIQGFSDAAFDIGSNRRQQEAQDLQQQKDNELKAAGENAELKAQIEESYRQRELAMRIRQAKADKQQAQFNNALNTATAVTAVLSTGGGTKYADFGISAGVLTALVIAQGLAQAAAIASRPLPQYFRGRENGPAEFALVGERGAELIEGRSGGMRLASGPMVTYLQAGDKVHTADRTQQLLQTDPTLAGLLAQRAYSTQLERQAAGAAQPATASASRVASQIALSFGRDADRIVRAVENIETTVFTEEGLRRYHRRGQHVTEFVNKHYRRHAK